MAHLKICERALKTLRLTNSMKQKSSVRSRRWANQTSWSLCKFSVLTARFQCMTDVMGCDVVPLRKCLSTFRRNVIFDAQTVEFDLEYSALQTKALRSFETSRTPLIQRHSVTSYKTTAVRTWNAYIIFVALFERGSAAARLLRLWVPIPPGAWMSVFYECCFVLRSLRRDDHSSRGVLPTVVCRSVWSRKPHEWGGPGPLVGCRAKNLQSSIWGVPITCFLQCSCWARSGFIINFVKICHPWEAYSRQSGQKISRFLLFLWGWYDAGSYPG